MIKRRDEISDFAKTMIERYDAMGIDE